VRLAANIEPSGRGGRHPRRSRNRTLGKVKGIIHNRRLRRSASAREKSPSDNQSLAIIKLEQVPIAKSVNFYENLL
jgi:hypothetical protein